MVDQSQYVEQLANSILELQELTGVYSSSFIPSLISELIWGGINLLLASTGEETHPGVEEDGESCSIKEVLVKRVPESATSKAKSSVRLRVLGTSRVFS